MLRKSFPVENCFVVALSKWTILVVAHERIRTQDFMRLFRFILAAYIKDEITGEIKSNL